MSTCIVCHNNVVDCFNIYSCETCKSVFCSECFYKCYDTGGGQHGGIYFYCPECKRIRDVHYKKPWLAVTDEELMTYLLKKCNFNDKEEAQMKCFKKKNL